MHNAHTKRQEMHKCIRAGGDPVEPALVSKHTEHEANEGHRLETEI